MELQDVIASRRAVFPRQMNGKRVPKDVINKILESANWAPTHRNTEPWRFQVYFGQAMNALLDLCKDCYVKNTPAEKFKSVKVEKIEERKQQVSHIIAICMKRNEILPEWEEIAATAMAVQNMWLVLSETNFYGGYWSTPAYALGEDFRSFLKLEEEERCLGLFYAGTIDKGAISGEGKRGDWREKVRLEG